MASAFWASWGVSMRTSPGPTTLAKATWPTCEKWSFSSCHWQPGGIPWTTTLLPSCELVSMATDILEPCKKDPFNWLTAIRAWSITSKRTSPAPGPPPHPPAGAPFPPGGMKAFPPPHACPKAGFPPYHWLKQPPPPMNICCCCIPCLPAQRGMPMPFPQAAAAPLPPPPPLTCAKATVPMTEKWSFSSCHWTEGGMPETMSLVRSLEFGSARTVILWPPRKLPFNWLMAAMQCSTSS
mmetsp:Transcript_43342/g.135552  ORF Transcript_43342/g.135552 Transcript_43342/m.135552 type:complete len:238 (-) Transcript_43342:76-789(-)